MSRISVSACGGQLSVGPRYGPARCTRLGTPSPRSCSNWASLPGGFAKQLGPTNAEMVYRRYHRFIPNLRGRDGANAATGLAIEGF